MILQDGPNELLPTLILHSNMNKIEIMFFPTDQQKLPTIQTIPRGKNIHI
jgi:hypothetical protein